MKYEVYCDEVLPDLFASQHPRSRYLMIGGLWLPAEMREHAKDQIHRLRDRHKVWGELKWRKISPAKAAFYHELVDMFLSYGTDMRFRCIAVDHQQVNLARHGHDKELGFYKFYYQLLHHWVLESNEYRIVCDLKSNRDRSRMTVLKRCLGYANRDAEVADVQSLPSSQLVLVQLCDVLLGAASSRLNETLNAGTAKESVVQHLETGLGRRVPLASTGPGEKKFNIFKIRLGGGR